MHQQVPSPMVTSPQVIMISQAYIVPGPMMGLSYQPPAQTAPLSAPLSAPLTVPLSVSPFVPVTVPESVRMLPLPTPTVSMPRTIPHTPILDAIASPVLIPNVSLAPRAAEAVPFQPPIAAQSFQPPVMAPTAVAVESEQPPLLIDNDSNDEEVGEEVGPRQEMRVALMSGVPVDADMRVLIDQSSALFKAQIVRSLALWNKGAILVEFDRPVVFSSQCNRVTLEGDRGVQIAPSNKPEVQVAASSHTLNVRVFVLDPSQDYHGTPEQVRSYDKKTQEWSTSRMQGLHPLRQLIERAGGEYCKSVIPPKQARMVSRHAEPKSQRCYTQLLAKFDDADIATRALSRMDGYRHTLQGFKVVVRAEYAKPFKK
eukprot:Hpha_TRINITY_DN16480_c8_g1::TRINITY_DN16480_c8_g1_i1::g.163785::m.163785